MLMTRPAIFIPVESKKREFDGKVLLAFELINRGFRVFLGTKSGVNREALHQKNGIYLAKSASNDNLELYHQLKLRGHRLAVLDVEGGALTREIHNDLLRSYQSEASAFFDYFYVFGDKIKESVVEHLPYIQPEQVIVTGEPRFDLLRPEYDRFFEREISDIRGRYGKFILINTSFGLSNSLLGEEGIRNFLETTSDIPDEQRPLYLLKHREGKILLDAFADLAKRIASEFPDLNVVIRPHPDEDPSIYQKLTAGCPNLHVNGKGNVHPWIKSACMVIHHDCTTGMESVMAGKPTISFVPRMEESITAWLPVYLSIACKTASEVLEAIKPYLTCNSGTYDPGLDKRNLFSSYFRNYTDLAAPLLADSLNGFYHSLPSSGSLSFSLLISRARSLANIRKYHRLLNEGSRERFMQISFTEVMEKLHLLDPDLKSGQIQAAVRGGNAILLERRGR